MQHPDQVSTMNRTITPEDIEEVDRWLQNQPPPASYFSMWGTGKDENNTSKQLAYFMSSHCGHGCHSAFTGAMFDCIGVTVGASLEQVSAVPEAITAERNRIDLFLQGPDWLMAIENKIGEKPYNDFHSYQRHGERFLRAKAHRYYVLLSRDVCEIPPDWRGVRYSDYLPAVRKRLAELSGLSTEQERRRVYATDFVEELGHRLQDAGTTAYLNFRRLAGDLTPDRASELWAAYLGNLQEELSRRLAEFGPVHVRDEGWALRCTEGRNRWIVDFQTPVHENGNFERKFRIGIWAYAIDSPEKITAAHEILDGNYLFEPYENFEGWEQSYRTRQEAMEGLTTLIRSFESVAPQSQTI